MAFVYGYIMLPSSTNTSRWERVWVVALGSAIIDGRASNTAHVGYFAGHFYSPRSLRPSLLSVPVFWLVSRVGLVLHHQVPMNVDL